MTGLQVDYWRLQETVRSNQMSEKQRGQELSEAIRHNKTTESETHRHNVATEQIQWAQVGETSRHNQVMEGIQNEYNVMWFQTQGRSLDIQQQQADVARQRADNESRRVQLEYQQFDWQRNMDTRAQGLRELQEAHNYETTVRSNEIAAQRVANDYEYNMRRLDQEQSRIDMEMSDLRRRWLGTTFESLDRFTNSWTNLRNAETRREEADTKRLDSILGFIKLDRQ